MGRLKPCDMGAEFGLMQPFGHEPAKASLSLRRMEVRNTVQGVPGEGRIALAGNHQHEADASPTRGLQKLKQAPARFLDSGSVEIEAALDLDLAARQPPLAAAVETCQRLRLPARRGTMLPNCRRGLMAHPIGNHR